MLLFAVTAPTIAAEAEDYSSTIGTFRSSPVVADFFRDYYGYAAKFIIIPL